MVGGGDLKMMMFSDERCCGRGGDRGQKKLISSSKDQGCSDFVSFHIILTTEFSDIFWF